jgi:hypothetical protein
VTQGETDLVAAILARLALLSIALDEDSGDLGSLPQDMAAFGALTRTQRVASRALLKSVEQTEDQLGRLFRLLPALKLIDTSAWFAQDYANFAEKIGILDDAFAWTAIIKLRNRLVHDYPLEPEAQLEMLTKAYNAVPLLQKAAHAAKMYIENGSLNGD